MRCGAERPYVSGDHGEAMRQRYGEKLAKLHDAEHLGRFEALLEAGPMVPFTASSLDLK